LIVYRSDTAVWWKPVVSTAVLIVSDLYLI
jgi:hypothetical protein